MIGVLVLACAFAGAVAIHAPSASWLWPWASSARRTWYGMLAGAALGLLVVPVVGLIAGLVFVGLSLAVLIAVVFIALRVARAMYARRL